jgi:phage FluMu protein Com
MTSTQAQSIAHHEYFRTKASQYYSTHKKQISDYYKEQVSCPHCNKILTRGGLSKHIKKYHAVPFFCELCNKDICGNPDTHNARAHQIYKVPDIFITVRLASPYEKKECPKCNKLVGGSYLSVHMKLRHPC